MTDCSQRSRVPFASHIHGVFGNLREMSVRSHIVNKLRSFTGAILSEEDDKNNNVTRSVENESMYSLAVSYFNDIKGRVDQVCHHITSRTSFDQLRNVDGHSASGDDCCMEKSNGDSDPNWKPGCLHRHHSSFSSWDHALSVHYSHVPPKLQEPYIEHGYLLPFMPWRYYLKALYTPGYELMNIWTHLIPSLYFMYLLVMFTKEFDVRDAWPLFSLTFCGSLVMGLSALAHMFHARSSIDHSCWFMVDYFGINVYAFGTIVGNFYTASLLKYYHFLAGCYLPIALTICSFGFFCLCITQTGTRWASIEISRKMKVYVNGIGYLFGAVPVLHRMGLNKMEGREELALWYHLLAIVTLVVAPMIYSTDFPQKYWPGRFNVFGHSHQIFHVLTASAVYFQIFAFYHDSLEGPWTDIHLQDSYPTLETVLGYYALLVSFSFFMSCFTRHVIKDDYLHEQPLLRGERRCYCGLPDAARFQEEENTHVSVFYSCSSLKKEQ